MKLTLILGALAAAALVLHFNRSASGPDIRTDRSTQIERAPSAGDLGRDGNASDSGTVEATDSAVPANGQRKERIVPPVKRVSPKAMEAPERADKAGTMKGEGKETSGK